MPKKVSKKGTYGDGTVVEIRPGVWRIRVRTPEKRISRTVKASEAQAIRVKNQIKKDVLDGAYVSPSAVLFKDLLNEWIENAVKAKSPGTYMLYRRTADKHVLPRL